MSTSYGNWLAPLMPVVLMLAIVIANHAIADQRSNKKAASESLRLSAALVAELRAMLDLYKINIDLIDKKANHLLSTRTMTAFYKGNLGRLTSLLAEEAIADVVAAFAQNERIESHVSAHSNLKCNLSFQFSPADVNFGEWRQMYEQASKRIIDACQMLEAGTRSTELSSKYQKIGRFFWAVGVYLQNRRSNLLKNSFR